MNSTELLALFRSDMRDEAVSVPLWTDTEIFSYMDDAQKMFCRLQGGIADSTSAVTQLSAAAGDKFVSISPRIWKLRAAYRASDGYELEILNFEDLASRCAPADYGQRHAYRIDDTPGEVRAIVVGMSQNAVRLVRIPETDIDINLIVYRMPLVDLIGANIDLEIPEHHHRHLLHWMKHLAYQKQDADTYDRGRSELFREEFLAYCDKAKAEREMLEHKYRTVQYGGY